MRQALFHLVLVAVVFSFCLSFADESSATLTPQTPKIGERITIAYNAASGVLQSSHEITAHVLLIRGKDMPVLVEVPLVKEGASWKGSFTLSDPSACYLIYQFVDSEKIDNHGDNVWRSLIADSTGKPVRNSYFYSGVVRNYPSYINFKNQKNPAEARKDIEQELKLYPDSWMAATFLWDLDLRATRTDETRERVGRELKTVVEHHRHDEVALASLLRWYGRVGQVSTGDSLKKVLLAEHPKGKIAEQEMMDSVYTEQDPAKRSMMLERFLADFSLDENTRKNSTISLITSYTNSNQYDKAVETLERTNQRDPSLYNNIAWKLVEKGENFEKGIALAKKGIDLLRAGANTKPLFIDSKNWKEGQKRLLAMTLDTYGFGCMYSKRTKEAEAAYAEAYQLTGGEDVDINNHAVEGYNANAKYAEAVKIAEASIRDGKVNDNLLKSYKEAYTKLHKSDKGFDKTLATLQAASQKKISDSATKQRLNTPAIDFTLKSLSGETVSLQSLRGKVVVVDFWATWCGPCRSSFPLLQKVYEKYKSNPGVKILALNTWERVTGAVRDSVVKKFIAENNYTFPVLYDEGMVEKYGVDGIPTKFIIDKKGNIAFKSVGFNGDEMVAELSAQLDLLLKE